MIFIDLYLYMYKLYGTNDNAAPASRARGENGKRTRRRRRCLNPWQRLLGGTDRASLNVTSFP